MWVILKSFQEIYFKFYTNEDFSTIYEYTFLSKNKNIYLRLQYETKVGKRNGESYFATE